MWKFFSICLPSTQMMFFLNNFTNLSLFLSCLRHLPSMATKAFIQNPNMKNVPYLRNRTPQEALFIPHTLCLPSPKNNSKRFVISNTYSSSILSPVILTSPPPVNRSLQRPCSSAAATEPLSRVWREIQGCNNWKDLIEPLNPLLQQEITRYGDLVSTCYKAFDLNPNSKRYLNCRYGKETLLKETKIDQPEDYQVTKYIYATPDININISPIQKETNRRARWVGYVAVSSDDSVKRLGRRDIVVTFRGTVTNPEWLANFMSSLSPARFHPHNPRLDVKVESGFLSLYTSDESESKFGLESCRQQLLSEISRLTNKYKGEEMSITLAGHSMGSSLAQLLAYDITELGLNLRIGEREIPVTVFSFAGPRVGNLAFKKRCEELGV